MKKRFAHSRRIHGRELLVIPQHGELLDTRWAKWLVDNQFDTLLHFAYELIRGDTTAVLHYDVKGLVSLKSYVRKQTLDEVGYVRLLTSVQDVLDTCASGRIPTELIIFDPSYVFVDNQAQPRYVVTPLDNLPFDVGNSPLAMLKLLGNARRLTFSSPSVETISSRLNAFVLNQNHVFSANAFRTFLRDQCGVGQLRRSARRDAFVQPEGTARKLGDTSVRLWSPVDGRSTPGARATHDTYQLERLSNGETYPLSAQKRFGVGRGSQNEIQLTGNPKLSRKHVVLSCMGDSVYLVDLGSANGTWVRGQRLSAQSRVTVPIGDRFSLANEEFIVRRY